MLTMKFLTCVVLMTIIAWLVVGVTAALGIGDPKEAVRILLPLSEIIGIVLGAALFAASDS